MFYRIIDKKLYDYADTQYSPDCQETDIITEQEYREHPNKVYVKEIAEEIQVPDYDEEGNIIGYHTETIYFYELALNPDYEIEEMIRLRAQLFLENTVKAKMAVENGYVIFEDAQFETNAQTVGDLTATMLLMQASGIETYNWLSKDDQIVELTLEDFGTLGGLIAGYKAHIWNEEYMEFKRQINNAQTIEELKAIVIEY